MKNILVILLGLALIGSYALYAAPQKPTPVEVWTGGDDGLTQHVRSEIENKFKSSSDFVLSSGKKPGTLIVTIPTHVAWEKKESRTQLRYTVQFSSSDGVVLGSSSGSCWDDNAAECATQIYRGAQSAAHKLH